MTSRWPSHEEDRSGRCYETKRLKRSVEKEECKKSLGRRKNIICFFLWPLWFLSVLSPSFFKSRGVERARVYAVVIERRPRYHWQREKAQTAALWISTYSSWSPRTELLQLGCEDERKGEERKGNKKRSFGLAIDETIWVNFSLGLVLILGLLCDLNTHKPLSSLPPRFLLWPWQNTLAQTRVHKHTQPAASCHYQAATDGLCLLYKDLPTGRVYGRSQTRLAQNHCLCVMCAIHVSVQAGVGECECVLLCQTPQTSQICEAAVLKSHKERNPPRGKNCKTSQEKLDHPLR